jgi:hypothetical protein
MSFPLFPKYFPMISHEFSHYSLSIFQLFSKYFQIIFQFSLGHSPIPAMSGLQTDLVRGRRAQVTVELKWIKKRNSSNTGMNKGSRILFIIRFIKQPAAKINVLFKKGSQGI